MRVYPVWFECTVCFMFLIIAANYQLYINEAKINVNFSECLAPPLPIS